MSSTIQLEMMLGMIVNAKHSLDEILACSAYEAIVILAPAFERMLENAREHLREASLKLICYTENLKYERREKRLRNRKNKKIRKIIAQGTTEQEDTNILDICDGLSRLHI